MVYVYQQNGEILYSRTLPQVEGTVIQLNNLPPKPVIPGYEVKLIADFENLRVSWGLVKTPALVREMVINNINNYGSKSYTLRGIPEIGEIKFWFNRELRSQFITELTTQLNMGKNEALLVLDSKVVTLPTKVLIRVFREMGELSEKFYKVQQKHIEAVNALEDVKSIESYNYKTGYPGNIITSLIEVQNRVIKSESSSQESMAVNFVKSIVNQVTVPVAKALEMQVLFPVWGQDGAEFGTTVEAGFRFRYVSENEKGQSTDLLYEVIQAHTLQENYVPGVSTASLYKVVEIEKAGTIDDPITYTPPMEVFNGKYYVQNEVKYLCTRDSGVALSHNLADLVGTYVEIV